MHSYKHFQSHRILAASIKIKKKVFEDLHQVMDFATLVSALIYSEWASDH